MKLMLFSILLLSLVSCEVESIEERNLSLLKNNYHLKIGTKIKNLLTGEFSNDNGALYISNEGSEILLKSSEIKLEGTIYYRAQNIDGTMEAKESGITGSFMTDETGDFEIGIDIINRGLITDIVEVDLKITTNYQGKDYEKDIHFKDDSLWSILGDISFILYEFNLSPFTERISVNGDLRTVYKSYDIGNDIILK